MATEDSVAVSVIKCSLKRYINKVIVRRLSLKPIQFAIAKQQINFYKFSASCLCPCRESTSKQKYKAVSRSHSKSKCAACLKNNRLLVKTVITAPIYSFEHERSKREFYILCIQFQFQYFLTRVAWLYVPSSLMLDR